MAAGRGCSVTFGIIAECGHKMDHVGTSLLCRACQRDKDAADGDALSVSVTSGRVVLPPDCVEPSRDLYCVLDNLDAAIRELDNVLEHPPSRLNVLGHLVICRGRIVAIRSAVSARAVKRGGA